MIQTRYGKYDKSNKQNEIYTNFLFNSSKKTLDLRKIKSKYNTRIGKVQRENMLQGTEVLNLSTKDKNTQPS